MTISREVGRYIPYLRRFSRALTGSREGGDAYALATLETLVADQKNGGGNGARIIEDPKIALYRLLLDIWAAAPINAQPEPGGSSDIESGARRKLDAISLRPRIAFLLNALEGFAVDEVARTLDVSTKEASALIEAANKEISDQIATDVLIIEDEPLIALDLREVVEELGHKVVSIARTHREAVSVIRQSRPGLILADIQLADGSSGLEAVNEILGEFSTPVIFITAYPERFLLGEAPEPAFLIAKPFAVDALKAVISQALFFDKKSKPSSRS
ncbi:response regulator [Methylocystis heyeri]|uniref:Response regulator n=1 Tax=Methylocystis heyeri TaxID=391905 RepID=A0A6B8KLL5_9HYPH|nr:response regulator [Methylocystis heyeri]QGM47593.1 response regulator [Methylocystis heyeri]